MGNVRPGGGSAIGEAGELNQKKLHVLYQVGAHLHQNPLATFVVGLLAGVVDRVHFVRETRGAPIAIEFAVGRAQLWPAGPLRVRARGLEMGDPMSLGSAIALGTDPVCVRIQGSGLEDDEAFQELLVESYEEVAAEGVTPEEKREHRAEALRQQIDQALKIYHECTVMLEEGDPARRSELESYLKIAREELRQASRELHALEEELAQAEQRS
ncbi:hypothetical protein [Limnochorda pilosa]|uniref:Uncharacterized protein n=1 Tax=Limnochorda pilosa TaxID=1555112 RepID=A0A0K2SHW5_LIMPI|nr:hypothetical protein [Limnochorda pilosa]BAS26665.1 hypothetical protein LIP_0808 [Limnochorda pilosa]